MPSHTSSSSSVVVVVWHGGVTARVLTSDHMVAGSTPWPFHGHVTTLGKLFTRMSSVAKQCNLLPA